MAVTLTKLKGPWPNGPILEALYSLAWDNSYPTGGEAIDISGDFTYCYGVVPAGNDTLADNGYLFQCVHPGVSTAVTSTNVKISVWWSADGTDGEVFVEFTNTGDLSAVGATLLWVRGR